MRHEDQRFHEGAIEQLLRHPEALSSLEMCGKILERDRRDLVQLLTFGRIEPVEYDLYSTAYENLATRFPTPQ